MPKLSLFNQMEAYMIAGLLFLIMIFAFLVGNRIRRYKERKGMSTEDKSIGAIGRFHVGFTGIVIVIYI